MKKNMLETSDPWSFVPSTQRNILKIVGFLASTAFNKPDFHVMSCFVFYISVSGPNCWNKELSVDLLSVKLTFAIPVSTLVLSLTTLANH